MNNLFISYDLIAPGQHYEQVSEKIKSLGAWAKVELSLFYVKSALGSEAVANAVYSVMDKNDKLIVIDTTNNSFHSFNLDPVVIKQMLNYWTK
ncbi:hypothetical protein ACO0LB_10140 [Undibacterium sp. SXout7W]|uniref:hypothetical protein n=1 Tax=Undibacterium sp. SXout7W TaxID=3413049 RepID=UPI003BF30CE1